MVSSGREQSSSFVWPSSIFRYCAEYWVVPVHLKTYAFPFSEDFLELFLWWLSPLGVFLFFLYRTLVIWILDILEWSFFLSPHSSFPPFCFFAPLSRKFLHPVDLFWPTFLFTFSRTSSHQFLSLVGLWGSPSHSFLAFAHCWLWDWLTQTC